MRFFGKLKSVVVSTAVGAYVAISSRSINKGIEAGKKCYSSMSKTGTKTITGGSDSGNGSGNDESPAQKRERKKRQEQERQEQLRLQRLRDEAARKALLAKRQSMIDAFQEKIKSEAEMYETNARRIYEETYEDLLGELSKIIDINPIRDFIVEKSKTFKNTMKYEVNSKVSLGNKKMVAIMDDESLSLDEYEDKLNAYVDNVYDKARQKLLAKIQKAVNETNEYIHSNAETFLNDEVEVVTSNNLKLKELSKKGSERDAELRKIAEQQVTLSFIQSTTNEIK